VVIRDAHHPITQGMSDFVTAVDELYHRMKMVPEAHVLQTAYASPDRGGTGLDENMAWVVEYGKGRVFQTVQGHGAEAMRATGFALMVRRGAEWAATGKVAHAVSEAEAAILGLGEQDGNRVYEVKTRLIAMAPQAVASLFDVLMRGDSLVGDEARDTLLWIAERWADSPSQREAVSKAIIEFAKTGQPVETRQFAIRLLGIVGRDEALPTLAAALKDEAVRDEAASSLDLVPGSGATKALLDALKGASGAFAVRLAQALGDHGDAKAVSGLSATAKSPDPTVRVAAIRALARLGEPSALPALEALSTDAVAAVREAALEAQLRIADVYLARQQAEKALAIYQRALANATTDPQRFAALVGIGRVGSPQSVSAIIPYLRDSTRPRLQLAAVGALRSIPGQEATAALVDAARGAGPGLLVALLDALGARGDASVVPVVAEQAGSADETARLAAIRALGEMASIGGMPAVESAMHSESEGVRSAAVDSALDIADAAGGSADPATLVPVYAQALKAAASDAQRVRALQGLGRLGSAEAVGVIEPVVDGGAGPVRDAAIAAFAAAAEALTQANAQEAQRIYRKLLDLLPADSRALGVARKLKGLGVDIDLGALQGFVTHWWVIGPFPLPWDTPQIPEQEINLGKSYEVAGRTVKWVYHHTDHLQGIVNLEALVEPNENVTAYAYAEVTSPVERDAKIKCGSDDGIVVWLNGQRVHANNASRGVKVDDDVVNVHLAAGVNKVLVKVINGGSDFEFTLRFTDSNDQPLRLATKTQ
jgi:HEAT repeat protein